MQNIKLEILYIVLIRTVIVLKLYLINCRWSLINWNLLMENLIDNYDSIYENLVSPA